MEDDLPTPRPYGSKATTGTPGGTLNQTLTVMKKLSYAKALREIGVTYLGGTSTSMKTRLSEEAGTLTYCVYLAPADMSGYNVCPCSKWCRRFCLNASGLSCIDILAGKNVIQKARVLKTIAFFEKKEAFMTCLITEINRARNRAKREGLNFAVRLNGTSDIDPEEFVYEGKCILDIFPDVQFYDYTKVPARFRVAERHPNYDLTFSFDGHNWKTGQKFIMKGGRVAVVFAHELPKTFHGYPVISGNEYDMRFLDPAGTVIGLHYHPVAADFQKGKDGHRKFVEPTTDFVIRSDNRHAVYAS